MSVSSSGIKETGGGDGGSEGEDISPSALLILSGVAAII